MKKFLVIDIETKETQTVNLDEAARIASLDPSEIEWALEEHGVCETDRHTITNVEADNPARVFMLEDGDRHAGYYRKRENAALAAIGLGTPRITTLEPPEPIACEDDEVRH